MPSTPGRGRRRRSSGSSGGWSRPTRPRRRRRAGRRRRCPASTIDGVTEDRREHRPGWIDFAGRRATGRACSSGRSTIVNDADAAGIAEMRFGAGVGEPGRRHLPDARHRRRVRACSTTACSCRTPSSATWRSAAGTPSDGRRRPPGSGAGCRGRPGRPTSTSTSQRDRAADLAEPDHPRRRRQQERRQVHPAPDRPCRGRRRRSCATTPGSSGRRWPRRSGRPRRRTDRAGRIGDAAYDRANPPSAAASRGPRPRGPDHDDPARGPRDRRDRARERPDGHRRRVRRRRRRPDVRRRQPGDRRGHRARRRWAAARTSTARSRPPRRRSRTARAGRPGPPASAAGRSRSSPRSSSSTPRSWPSSRAANVGKPITGARGEIVGVEPRASTTTPAPRTRSSARRSRSSKPGLDLTLREPIGVVGLIVPWNFPLLMASWKVAPGAGRRQHRDPQARQLLAADRDPPRRAGARGGHPARRPQRRHRPGRHRPARRSRPTRASARSRSPARRRPARRSCGWPRAT